MIASIKRHMILREVINARQYDTERIKMGSTVLMLFLKTGILGFSVLSQAFQKPIHVDSIRKSSFFVPMKIPSCKIEGGLLKAQDSK